jgi:hypothetical protein
MRSVTSVSDSESPWHSLLSAYDMYAPIKEWVVLRGHERGICCTSYLTLQSPTPNALLTLDHQTVHPILVSCSYGGEILFWDLSSPTVGHTTNFHNFSIIVHSRRRHFASITCRAAYARAINAGTANPRLRDTLSSAQLNNQNAYIPPARPPARLHVERPHDPFLDARATCLPCLGLSPVHRSALDCRP